MEVRIITTVGAHWDVRMDDVLTDNAAGAIWKSINEGRTIEATLVTQDAPAKPSKRIVFNPEHVAYVVELA